MKKIFKMFIYMIETKVCNMIDNLVSKVDRQYTNIKFKNAIETSKLIEHLKQHVVQTNNVINILENHFLKLNKTK